MIDTDNINGVALRNAVTILHSQVSANLGPKVKARWDSAIAQSGYLDALVPSLECMYAHMVAVPADAPIIATVLGQLGYMLDQNRLWEQGKNGRALDIYKACLRALGDTVPGSGPAVDPDLIEVALP